MGEPRAIQSSMEADESTCRLLRVPVSPLRTGNTWLDEGTSRYVARVHRLKAGARFLAFDPEASVEALATLLNDRLPRLEVEVGDLVRVPDLPWRVTLLQGLGKGDKPEQVVRDATVLGAHRVVFVEAKRSVARGHGAGRRERERRVAVEAARQAGRGHLPVLVGPCSLTEALGDISEGAEKLVCAWHEDARPLLEVLPAWSPGERELVLLIGPEGGFSAQELTDALGAGFCPVSLGPFVLRTETAATVALGLVQGYAAAQEHRRESVPQGSDPYSS